MKHYRIILFATLALTSCSVQRHTETVTHRDTTHEEAADSVRYEITTIFRDTTHYKHIETEKRQTIEYFDPETGKLRQRVTESERELKEVFDYMLMMQARIDSLESHHHEASSATTDEVTEKDTETENSWAVRIALVCVAIFLGLIMNFWKRIVK